MPKQKQYEDALGSVFDFIFTESQKPPDKRKPVKITGFDGTSEYIDALAAVLENPGQFVNKTAVDAFNDVVNTEVAVVNLGPGEQIKLRLLDIKGVLNNDLSFVDNQFKRLETNRKLGKLAWAGQQLSGIVAATWAKKYGLDLETQNALFNVGGKESFLDKRPNKPEERLGAWAKNRDYLEKIVKGRFGDYRNISEDTLKISFGDKEGAEIYKQLQGVFKIYDDGVRKGLNNNELSSILDKVSDNNYQTLYPVFEGHNMALKAAKARASGETELADKYERAEMGVRLFTERALRNKHISEIEDNLKQYKISLSTLLKSDNPDRNLIKDLRAKITDTNKELRMFRTQKVAQRLGEWDGLLSSVSSTWEYTMGGQFIPAILSGDFFDKRKNVMFKGKYMPVEEREVLGISRFIQGGKKDMPKFKLPKIATGKGSKFLNAYYEMMTEVYYNTPAVWIKTLSTGEGFAYRAFKQQEKFLKLMEREGWFDKVNLNQLFGENGEAYLHSFTDILDQEKFNKLLKFVKKNERLQKLAYEFGTLSRAKEKFSKFLIAKVGAPIKGLRVQIAKGLLKIVKDGPARRLIAKWAREGGFKVLLQGIKTAIISALGVTSAGVGAVIGFAVDLLFSVAIEIGMKIAKPIMKVSFTLLILTIVGIVAVIVIIPSMFFVTLRNQYAHVAPGEVILGEKDFKVLYTDGGGSDSYYGDIPPLPDGVECPLGSEGSYRCTQGPLTSGTHSSLDNAIDVGYNSFFYAPSFCGNKNCYVTDHGVYPYCNQKAGNYVKFEAEYEGTVYEFYLVHTVIVGGLDIGSELGSQQAVGKIQIAGYDYYIWPGYKPDAPLIAGDTCSSGDHLHLEMTVNGKHVDPGYILRDRFGCPLTPCP